MRRHILLCSFAALLGLTLVPSLLWADAFCSEGPPYQYQSCGIVAAGNTFTVNQAGPLAGVYGVFEGYHADFASSVYAILYDPMGRMIAQSPESLSNQDLIFNQLLPFFSPLQVQVGDTVEFVLHDKTDPNGQALYFSQRYQQLNPDHLNHTWAENLDRSDCPPLHVTTCLFMGFEDIPLQEGSDFDYNDFKMWVYGVDLSPGASSPIPEPSAIILLIGAPLAFAFGKLRRFF